MSKKTSKEKENVHYVPLEKPRKNAEIRAEREAERLAALKEKYDSKNKDVPPLSTAEKEHLTYLRVLNHYNELKERRDVYRRYGSIFIFVSAVIFLVLMFGLNEKIEFLGLWIIVVIYCVVVMIRAEYKYHTFKEFLGIADEFDYYEIDSEEEEEDMKFRDLFPFSKNNKSKEEIPLAEANTIQNNSQSSGNNQNINNGEDNK